MIWRNACSASARAREAVARASAAVRTSPSSASSRSRAFAAPVEPFVPSALAAVLLAEQRAQPCGRELAREGLGLGGELLVLDGHLGLLLQRLQLAPELGEHVRQAQQVLVETGELALGPLLAPPVLGDAGGFLDVLAPLLGLGVEHLFELALAHHRVQRAPDARLAQELLDVQQPDVLRR